MNVLILDNYDSFVYNLRNSLEELGAHCTVIRNDSISIDEVRAAGPDAIVISPGPGVPGESRDFGICGEVLTTISHDTPTLGVCLGHQGIAHYYGGRVVRAPPVHGKASPILHDGAGIYEGLPDPFTAGRYHSYIVDDDLPSDLMVTSRTADGTVMGIRHRRYPIEGVQFHPESVLTPIGGMVLSNFLRGARA
ncbi:MAG: aminodeoxychorismate/anthranilate synthase component II [Methanomassiliicoccus sp.]|nr:aminodeoxychorismate/anthranilate synthase component II [Methanomassiliicoccus sp.]